MKNFSLPIKGVKQKKLHCGPACMEMVLSFYGHKVKQEIIGKEIMVNVKRGCYPHDVIKYLKKYNIIAEKQNKLIWLNYIEERKPIIIGTYDHFMLLVGHKKGKYIVIDPYTGKREKFELSFFKEKVKDYIIIKEIKSVNTKN